jgi:hypothetical protein
MYICLRIHTHTHTCIQQAIRLHTCMHTTGNTYTYLHTCIHTTGDSHSGKECPAPRHSEKNASPQGMYACMYAFMYVCMYGTYAWQRVSCTPTQWEECFSSRYVCMYVWYVCMAESVLHPYTMRRLWLLYVCVHVYVRTCTQKSKYICQIAYIYIYIYIYIYVIYICYVNYYLHVCVLYVCMYLRICMSSKLTFFLALQEEEILSGLQESFDLDREFV